MAFTKVYDAAVVTGSYTNGQGEAKKRYKNIGSIWKGDDGNSFMRLDASFNPAGIPRQEGSDTIIVSFFQPKDKDGNPTGGQQQKPAAQPQRQPQNSPTDGDIPF